MIPQESGKTEPGKMEPRKLRLLLVDDHFYIREGLKSLLGQEADMEVIGEAADGESACRLAARASDDPADMPDIIIMDLSLGSMHGTAATAKIKTANPRVLVVALSMHEDATYVRAVLEAGASGYVLKRSATRELVQAIRSVAAGGTYLDPAVAGKLTAEYVRRRSSSTPQYRGDTFGYDLTEREEEVLGLVAQGFTSREIAVQLGISPKSVESYKMRALRKAGIETRVEITRYAVLKGWL
jgi:DNA-binding NarL/FixJ family response regulator